MKKVLNVIAVFGLIVILHLVGYFKVEEDDY